MGRGSPRRGSGNIDKRQKRNDINWAHKSPQHQIPLWKSIQHIYETPEILRSTIFTTVSCLQSDNGVCTSNSPPARNIVMIYPDYYIETCIPNTKILQGFSLPKSGKQNCCICKNTQIHSLFLQKHPWPLNQKHYYSVFSIDHFESNFVNSDKYPSENKPKKHIKIEHKVPLSSGPSAAHGKYFATALTALAISVLVNKAIHKSALIISRKGKRIIGSSTSKFQILQVVGIGMPLPHSTPYFSPNTVVSRNISIHHHRGATRTNLLHTLACVVERDSSGVIT